MIQCSVFSGDAQCMNMVEKTKAIGCVCDECSARCQKEHEDFIAKYPPSNLRRKDGQL